jgi:opacity protein-like surface antigen
MSCIKGPVAAALALLVLALPASAADTKVGIRGGYYTDIGDPFLGAELLTPVAHRIYFNPNFEYVFDDNLRYWTLNGDFHYDFPTHRPYYVWAGAGLALVHTNLKGRDNGNTDVGANLLAGVGFKAGSVVPYFQAKVILKDGSEFALAFGIRF